MNILLICAGGISSGLFAKKIVKEYAEQGVTAEVNAVGFPLLNELVPTSDVVLVAPQLKFNEKGVAEACARHQKQYIMIDNMVYAKQDASKIIKEIQEKLGEENK